MNQRPTGRVHRMLHPEHKIYFVNYFCIIHNSTCIAITLYTTQPPFSPLKCDRSDSFLCCIAFIQGQIQSAI